VPVTLSREHTLDRKGPRVAVLVALAAPFLLAVPQGRLIPSWYDASVYVAGALLVVSFVAVALAVAWFLRRSRWNVWGRLAASLAVVLVGVVAALVTWESTSREGTFLCGRELQERVPCPGGGEAFRFLSVCIAGNPTDEVELRSGILPFMHPVSEPSAQEACAALRGNPG
jgi:hypothetical protein